MLHCTSFQRHKCPQTKMQKTSGAIFLCLVFHALSNGVICFVLTFSCTNRLSICWVYFVSNCAHGKMWLSKSNFGLLVLLLLTYHCCNGTPEGGREHNVNKEEEVKPGPFNQTFSTMIAATFLYTLLTLFTIPSYVYIQLLLLSKLHYRSPNHNLYMVT